MTAIATVAPRAVSKAPVGAPAVAPDKSTSMLWARTVGQIRLPKNLFSLFIVSIVVFALSIQLLSSGIASRACPLMGPERSYHGLCDGMAPVCLRSSNSECCSPASVILKATHSQISSEWHQKFMPAHSPVLSGTSTKPPLPPPIREVGFALRKGSPAFLS